MARMAILKIALHLLCYVYKSLKQVNICTFFFNGIPSSSRHPLHSRYPSAASLGHVRRKEQTYSLACDFHGTLLRSTSLFPFFMVVAFEGGGLLRAVLLLLSFPLLLVVGQDSELGLKMMVFVTFCGLRTRDMEIVARAVLNKVYLENLHRGGYELVAAAGRKVVVTNLPRVMVERYLREYIGADEVIAAELEVVKKGVYFTGLMVGLCRKGERQMALRELLGEDKFDVGLASFCTAWDEELVACSKEVYVLNREETTTLKLAKDSLLAGEFPGSSSTRPKPKYPKPLVFHDGRLAFLPTPSATLAVLLFLPFTLILSIIRILCGILFPYCISITIASALGVHIRVSHPPNCSPNSNSKHRTTRRGVLYVCSHRTLVDPIILSVALASSVPAVTYSLSPITEAVSPIPTVRLTRDRHRDATTIRTLLAAGNLAICPEGTTCREPYLLRFSPLFSELAHDIEPVAIDVEASMFYGTTASGIKSLDPIFFFMNPRPWYYVGFLGRVSQEMTVAGGLSAADVANGIQRKLADALGFECTTLTRRDKYLMLAGNDGVVALKPQEKA